LLLSLRDDVGEDRIDVGVRGVRNEIEAVLLGFDQLLIHLRARLAFGEHGGGGERGGAENEQGRELHGDSLRVVRIATGEP
jgi:hypothetical protein